MPLFAFAFTLLAQTPASSTEPVEIPFRQLALGSNVRIKDAGAIVIRDAKGFDAFRKEMGMTDARKPKIDWAKEQLVSVYTSGTAYGGAAFEVGKVRRMADGSLEVEASLNRGDRSATLQPGVPQVLRKVGFFALIAVAKGPGGATLKLVDPK